MTHDAYQTRSLRAMIPLYQAFRTQLLLGVKAQEFDAPEMHLQAAFRAV